MSGETITVVRPGTRTDRYGATQPDWTVTTSHVIRGVKVSPTASRDVTDDARDGHAATLNLFLPPRSNIEATDRVELRGSTWRILGEASDWRRPSTGRGLGLVVTVTRTEG